MTLAEKIFGTHSSREIKMIKPIVDKIESLRPQMQALSDEELRDKTKEYKDLFNKELVFVFIKVVENQKNIDIDNKFIKPIVDGLVLSKVIADDNINNMFYGVLGTTNKKKKPYTEVYVFRGEKMLDFIKNQIEADTK